MTDIVEPRFLRDETQLVEFSADPPHDAAVAFRSAAAWLTAHPDALLLGTCLCYVDESQYVLQLTIGHDPDWYDQLDDHALYRVRRGVDGRIEHMVLGSEARLILASDFDLVVERAS